MNISFSKGLSMSIHVPFWFKLIFPPIFSYSLMLKLLSCSGGQLEFQIDKKYDDNAVYLE